MTQHAWDRKPPTPPTILPEGVEEIAHGGDILVYEYDGRIYLKGVVSGTTIGFNRSEWDLFSAVIRLADLRLKEAGQ